MLDKIYNFVKLDFVINENYNGTESLKVYAECGIEYNKLISLVNPITKFEFINDLGQIVLTAKFKCSIALIHAVDNLEFSEIKKEVLINIFDYLHAMSIGYFTHYNELQSEEIKKINLLPINYKNIVNENIKLA